MELSGRTVAITGIGGFIGLHLAVRARERGAVVRGMDASPQAVERARRAGFAGAFLGDVTSPADAAAVCQAADVVLHTAAVLGEDNDFPRYTAVNVEGTRNVVTAARAAGAARVVHLSSVMVYGFRYPDLVDEDGPQHGEANAYCQTKIWSERIALAAHTPGRTEVTVVRPGDVYGPGSVPWVIRPLDLLRKGLFVLPDGGSGTLNHVHVDNLVDAIFLALERDATTGGRAFNVTDGARTTFKQYFDRLAALAGRGPVRTLPANVLRAVFAVAAGGARLLGRAPPAEPSAVDFLTRPYPYSIARARADLGYTPRVTLEQGFAQLARWLRETRSG